MFIRDAKMSRKCVCVRGWRTDWLRFNPLPKKNVRGQFASYFNLRKIEISYVQNCFYMRMVTIANISQRRKISKLRARLELWSR